ncbi:MAG: EamA family transporter RarD [Pseudomonadota bacterium]
MSATATDAGRETSIGFLAGVGAFSIWGVMPLFYKLLGHVPPTEVLAHRVFWSLPALVALAAVMAKWSDIKRLFLSPRCVAILALTTLLILINWGLFIWSIANERLLDASLGYFINPLMSVAIGAAFLGEKISGAQKIAIGLAGVAIAQELVTLGRFPWISLTLSTSFATYGYLRKTINADAVSGHFVEIALIAPIALGIILFWQTSGAAGFGAFDDAASTAALLIAAGPFTVAPLILFTMGARRLPLSTIGLLQYGAPSLQFLIGVAYGEPFTLGRAVTFGLIWAGLAVFSIDLWRRDRAQKLAMGPMAAAGDGA